MAERIDPVSGGWMADLPFPSFPFQNKKKTTRKTEQGSSLKPVEQSVANLSPINLSVRPTRWRKANISTNANSFKVRSGYRNSEGKELNINDSNEAMENKDDQSTKTKPHEETGQGTSKNDIQNEAGKEKRSIKENIDEIEAALAQLKKELGL
ncbi:hypothetical protein MRB53_015470 [Persea americana]|uniref:Uncharacterized protein n=1 Tax=Persea americana TaxID=3435 RepID=A0ACC2LZG9_PERAE|nr:hypothetical protein MRB53_015470 [Persea americana]